MAQQASPNVIGHMLDSRAQLMACSSEVVMTLSSKRPSSHPIAQAPAHGGYRCKPRPPDTRRRPGFSVGAAHGCWPALTATSRVGAVTGAAGAGRGAVTAAWRSARL